MTAAPVAADVEAWSGKDRGDENFPVGSLIISRAQRPHVHAYYAFARNADDIADSRTLPADEKVARLDIMKDVLLGRRDSGSPSAVRLRQSLAETGVPAVHATDLLIAFRRDATKLRYASVEELHDYCRYSAAPVGRYVLDLHHEDHAVWPASDALCTSLQILNHLQDCARDLESLDRCYLPEDLMSQFGVTTRDLQQSAESPDLRRVLNALLRHTTQLNEIAAGLPAGVRNRRLRIEIAVIVNLARRLTRRLQRQDPLAARVRLTKGDAALSVLRALRFGVS
jgi:farnesyl-diphosphate farnesyltransferase